MAPAPRSTDPTSRARRRLAPCAAALLALAGCAIPTIDVTVSEPKVFGDDTVLRTLADQRARVRALASGIRPGDYQESFGVGHVQATRRTISASLAEADDAAAAVLPATSGTSSETAPSGLSGHGAAQVGPGPGGWGGGYPGLGWAPPWGGGLLLPLVQPLMPGLTFQEQLRQRVEASQLVSSYELLYLGDTRLLGPRSRAALLRFELSFNGYADLGSRRRFVVVEFQARPKHERTPPFGVYLLSPEFSSMVSHEVALDRQVEEYAAQLLGSWGGVGLSAGQGGRDERWRELESMLETPLQFAIYDGRRQPDGSVRFAFAFGPRRRLIERSTLNPSRWFGSPYEIAYELQPGARTCQVLLLFREVDPHDPLDVVISVSCDGQLAAEEDIALASDPEDRPVRLTLRKFEVACPAIERTPSSQLELVAGSPGDLLIDGGPNGPAFSSASQVFVGSLRIPAEGVELLGRGRLTVRVPPLRLLAGAEGEGVTTLSGRVVTPDQPDYPFVVQVQR